MVSRRGDRYRKADTTDIYYNRMWNKFTPIYIKFRILFIEFVINTYLDIITFSFAYQSSLPHLDSKALKDNTHL